MSRAASERSSRRLRAPPLAWPVAPRRRGGGGPERKPAPARHLERAPLAQPALHRPRRAARRAAREAHRAAGSRSPPCTAWAGSARPSWRSNTPIATPATSTSCGGCAPSSRQPSSKTTRRSPGRSSCRKRAGRSWPRSPGRSARASPGATAGSWCSTTRAGPNDLEHLLPPGGGGRVLITSRHPDWPYRRRARRADPGARRLDRAPSRSGPARTTGRRPTRSPESWAICRWRSPRRRPTWPRRAGTLAAYLDLFRTRRQELWSQERPPHGYPETVGTTWTMAVEQLRDEEPLAVDLLGLCAFLAPEAIPRRLLAEHHEALPAKLGAAVADPLRFNRLIGALRRYSLVEATGDGAELPPPGPGGHARRARGRRPAPLGRGGRRH